MDNSIHFDGFSTPNGTIVPDEFFDVLAPGLTEAELRVLLYLFRRIFGFKKQSDEISLSQMVEGITTRDGRVLDRGAGVVKSAAARAIRGLERKGIIIAVRRQSKERGFQPTTYALRFREQPMSPKGTRGGPPKEQGHVLQKDIQQTVEQQTAIISNIEGKHRRTESVRAPVRTRPERPGGGFSRIGVSLSHPPAPSRPVPGDRAVIEPYIQDIAGHFHDRATLRASTTRALRLMQQCNIDRAAFVSRLFEARSLTNESIKSGTTPIRNQMAFFFSVLTQRLGLTDELAPGWFAPRAKGDPSQPEPVRSQAVPGAHHSS